MKNILSLLLLVVATIVSCKKADNGVTTSSPVEGVNDGTYALQGVEDMTVKSIQRKEYTIDVVRIDSSSSSRINLLLEGLPSDVKYYFSKNNERAPFTTVLKIESELEAVGTYDIKVIGSANGKHNKYAVKLIIEEGFGNGMSCDALFDNKWPPGKSTTYIVKNGIDTKIQFNNTYNFSVVKSSIFLGFSASNIVFSTNYMNTGQGKLKVITDCVNRTFTIADHQEKVVDNVRSYNYLINNSKGTFNKNGYTFYYDVTLDGVTTTYKLVAEFDSIEVFM